MKRTVSTLAVLAMLAAACGEPGSVDAAAEAVAAGEVIDEPQQAVAEVDDEATERSDGADHDDSSDHDEAGDHDEAADHDEDADQDDGVLDAEGEPSLEVEIVMTEWAFEPEEPLTSCRRKPSPRDRQRRSSGARVQAVERAPDR